jgi:hypothetical protein
VRTAFALAVAVFVGVACSRDAGTPEPATPACEVRFAAPGGFAPLESFEERYDDRIGVRLGFADARDRELHLFAGIPGEFGEGLPDAGSLPLTDGRTGTLVGRDDVWIVTWEEGDRCDPRAVLANGFSRKAFEAALTDAGLLSEG